MRGQLDCCKAKPTLRLRQSAVNDSQDILAHAGQKSTRLTLNVQPGSLPCVSRGERRDEQLVHAYARTSSSV